MSSPPSSQCYWPLSKLCPQPTFYRYSMTNSQKVPPHATIILVPERWSQPHFSLLPATIPNTRPTFVSTTPWQLHLFWLKTIGCHNGTLLLQPQSSVSQLINFIAPRNSVKLVDQILPVPSPETSAYPESFDLLSVQTPSLLLLLLPPVDCWLLPDEYSVILLLWLPHHLLCCAVANGQPASLLFADAGWLLLLIIFCHCHHCHWSLCCCPCCHCCFYHCCWLIVAFL